MNNKFDFTLKDFFHIIGFVLLLFFLTFGWFGFFHSKVNCDYYTTDFVSGDLFFVGRLSLNEYKYVYSPNVSGFYDQNFFVYETDKLKRCRIFK